MFRGKFRRVHFVGIGGSGMSGIAEVLLEIGLPVSGSDARESAAVSRLRAMGAVVAIGHSAGNVAGADVVVRSTAIPEGNVELVAARAAHIPVIARAEMLAELMRLRYGIGVAGTHGKTTTTSMVGKCLHHAGLDPTVIIGGRLDHFGSSARRGHGEYLVAEADESDGSFLLLAPTIAVVTNVDAEHMEHWGDFTALVAAFDAFANKVPFYGFAVLCADHPVCAAMSTRLRRRVVSYGLHQDADYRAEELAMAGGRTRFTAVARGPGPARQALGPISLGMPGRHNAENAMAAIAVGMELGIPFSTLQEALSDFGGVDRRFSVRADAGGVLVVDDYGHHPAEIRATLAAAADGYPGRRVLAVFQPHRYSRVHNLAREFCESFDRADRVLVCPVYAAGERPIEGATQASLVDGLRAHGHGGVSGVASLDEALDTLAAECRPGDLVITLGAGDVNRICLPLGERLG
jgi:UDP-N-acetylmuramate--alanine ligase